MRFGLIPDAHIPTLGSEENLFDFPCTNFLCYTTAQIRLERYAMPVPKTTILLLTACLAIAACSTSRYLKGGIYRDLNENLTIVGLTESPNFFLNKEVVMSVRFFEKSDLPCPLGEDYVNFIIADRVSYIMLNKVWMKKDKVQSLETLKKMDTIIMRARIFKVDKEKDPNLEALEIVKE